MQAHKMCSQFGKTKKNISLFFTAPARCVYVIYEDLMVFLLSEIQTMSGQVCMKQCSNREKSQCCALTLYLSNLSVGEKGVRG